MENQTFFKTTAFGGFDKKAVLEYIDKFSAQCSEREQWLNNQIAELTAVSEQLRTQVGEFDLQTRQLDVDLQKEKEHVQELSGVVDTLNAELNRCRAMLEEKDQGFKQLAEQNRQLTFRAESLEYKGRKYDEATAHIGETLLNAQQTAQEMIQTAERKANEMTEALAASLAGINGQIDDMGNVLRSLRLSIAQSLERLDDDFEQLDQNITQIKCALVVAPPAQEEQNPQAEGREEERSDDLPFELSVSAEGGQEREPEEPSEEALPLNAQTQDDAAAFLEPSLPAPEPEKSVLNQTDEDLLKEPQGKALEGLSEEQDAAPEAELQPEAQWSAAEQPEPAAVSAAVEAHTAGQAVQEQESGLKNILRRWFK